MLVLAGSSFDLWLGSIVRWDSASRLGSGLSLVCCWSGRLINPPLLVRGVTGIGHLVSLALAVGYCLGLGDLIR